MKKDSRQYNSKLVESLSDYHKRQLLTIPVIKKYSHSALSQRCGLKVATIELDTASYPSIEYVAGTRLSIYPINSESSVNCLLQYFNDDLHTIFQANDQIDPNYNSPFWIKFIQTNKRHGEALRLALTYYLDLTSMPSRDLLRYIGDCCSNRGQRHKMEAIVSNNDSWERYICQDHRTLISVLEEFNSAKGRLSAKRTIIHELIQSQQARQYSISNIKSNRRFRAEIIVFQHKFTAKQIALNLKTIQEHENELNQMIPQQEQQQQQQQQPTRSPKSPLTNNQSNLTAQTSSPNQRVQRNSTIVPSQQSHINDNNNDNRRKSPLPLAKPQQQQQQKQQLQQVRDRRLSSSARSLRSIAVFSSSPISSQQVRQLPVYSGPLMSLYAASTRTSRLSSSQTQSQGSGSNNNNYKSIKTINSVGSNFSQQQQFRQSLLSLPDMVNTVQSECSLNEDPKTKRFEGLCSNYLLNLQAGDQVLCEIVENPRFTLKGNRERPIMMIAQDVGLVAFRPFWQQRQLEYDRAQMFYTMFKDLSPKKFGEMQLVCLTGNKCKVEDLFRRDINAAQANKILSLVTYVNRQQLVALLDMAAKRGTNQTSQYNGQNGLNQLPIQSKELLDLGNRIYRLLVENNGCLYTSCDPHMTQAIEILTVECILRYNRNNWTYEQIVAMLPKWKGRDEDKDRSGSSSFKLENTFERANFVQEIYESSI